MYTAEEWLLTEGNQYVVVGQFKKDENGNVKFVDEKHEPIPVPVWAMMNMMDAYREGILKTGLIS